MDGWGWTNGDIHTHAHAQKLVLCHDFTSFNLPNKFRGIETEAQGLHYPNPNACSFTVFDGSPFVPSAEAAVG